MLAAYAADQRPRYEVMQQEAEARMEAERKRTQAEQAEVIALHARLQALEMAAGDILPEAETTEGLPEAIGAESARGQALPRALAAVRSAVAAVRSVQQASGAGRSEAPSMSPSRSYTGSPDPLAATRMLRD